MRASYDVLIVTALLDELKALESVAYGATGGWSSGTASEGSPLSYCTLKADDGTELHVAAAWTGAMGETAAAATATALVTQFSPACIAMCGICAGYRGKVSLGDVIVADRVYSYDHGKLIAVADAQGKRSEDFYHDIQTYSPPPNWRMDVGYVSKESAWSTELRKTRPLSLAYQKRWLLDVLLANEEGRGPAPLEHPNRLTSCPAWSAALESLKTSKDIAITKGQLRLTAKGRAIAQEQRLLHPDGVPGDPTFAVHVGPIATGKTVREDAELFPNLEQFVRKTLGVEMEAAAIGHVAERFNRPAIIVKAVSDHADHEKDDSFRKFAATASAEFLVRFLCRQGARIRQRPGDPAPPPMFVKPTPPTSSTNPFQTGGTLSPGHPTYVRRASDVAFDHALEDKRLISIEAPPGMGKSSLMMRAQSDLKGRTTVCYVDLSGLSFHSNEVFYRGLYKKLSTDVGKTINDVTDLEELGGQKPILLMLDEFGHPTPEILKRLVPALYYLATKGGTGIRIVVAQPGSLRHLIQETGLDNDKYYQAFQSIVVGPLADTELSQLLSLLSPRARQIAITNQQVIAKISKGHPRAVQLLCYQMFDAELAGKSDEDLLKLVSDGAMYA